MEDSSTPEQLEQDAKSLGKHIGALLATADLPDDAKAAFLELLPSMTPEQMDKLVKLLESKINETSDDNTAFAGRIAAINQRYDEQEQVLKAQEQKELDEIERAFSNE